MGRLLIGSAAWKQAQLHTPGRAVARMAAEALPASPHLEVEAVCLLKVGDSLEGLCHSAQEVGRRTAPGMRLQHG